MSNLLDFISVRIGHSLKSPGGKGGECVDLVELWLLALGAPTIGGNAVDLWANAPTNTFLLISNGPTNAPRGGDVVVWHRAPSAAIGVNGHTAVCVVADVNRLLTFDQNWPEHSPAALVVHNYVGVTGWIRARAWDGPQGTAGPS